MYVDIWINRTQFLRSTTHFGHQKNNQKIDIALNHVQNVIHHNPNSKRNTATLFAGNLDFKAKNKDILKLLQTHYCLYH